MHNFLTQHTTLAHTFILCSL